MNVTVPLDDLRVASVTSALHSEQPVLSSPKFIKEFEVDLAQSLVEFLIKAGYLVFDQTPKGNYVHFTASLGVVHPTHIDTILELKADERYSRTVRPGSSGTDA